MSHGASPRKGGLVDVNRIWQLHLHGVPSAAIAARLGCSQRSVNAAVQMRRANEATANDRRASA